MHLNLKTFYLLKKNSLNSHEAINFKLNFKNLKTLKYTKILKLIKNSCFLVFTRKFNDMMNT